MARTLNTSDPLYASLTALILLDDDDVTVKELKAGTTLTAHANVRFPPTSDGTPYGRSFEPGGPAADGNSSWNVALPASGAISVPTNAPMSVFMWHNGYVDTNTGWAAYARMMGGAETPGRHCGTAFQFDPADGRLAPCSINGALSLTSLNTVKSASDARPAGSIAFTRNASNPLKLWINGARDANYSGSGMAINTGVHGGPQANSEFFCLGGMLSAQTWSRWSWVGIAIFVGYELTDSDYARLHASLGVNTMAMLTAPSDPAPIITGPGGSTGSTSSISIVENTTAVHTFTANESVTWSLNGGADAARFSINSGGALSFNSAPNFEAPNDADTNNTYIVVVRATDGASNTTDQTCTVTVTDTAEGGGIPIAVISAYYSAQRNQ